jgi:sugar/nucleoside kinase (ribokinase family)
MLIPDLAKTFRYTTEPLKTEPRHLLDTPLLSSQYFHILTSVNDATDQVRELLKLRNSRGIEELPTIIWEPAPLSCLLENLASCLKAIKLIDVFSPNHIELAALFGIDANRDGQCERATIQELGYKCLLNGIGAFNKGTVVIRAGHEGCCVFSRKQQNFVWLPPYYLKSKKVVDPTGAGNAFLGGFAVGLMETGDDITAACYGMIASTFALEQTGLPVLDSSRSVTADGITTVLETWNGTSVRARLQEYVLRIGLPLETPSIACELAARPSVD